MSNTAVKLLKSLCTINRSRNPYIVMVVWCFMIKLLFCSLKWSVNKRFDLQFPTVRLSPNKAVDKPDIEQKVLRMSGQNWAASYTWQHSTEAQLLAYGNKMFCKGNDDNNTRGVVILGNKKISSHISAFQAISIWIVYVIL